MADITKLASLFGVRATPMGIAVPAALGVAQLVEGIVKKNKANKAGPPLVDPEEQAMLEEVRRKKRTFETGSAYNVAKREIRRGLGNTQSGILKLAGGNIGSAMMGLARTQTAAGTAFNETFAQGMQTQAYYDDLASKIQSNIIERKKDLQMYKQDALLAEAAQAKKQGLSNLLASVAFNQGGGNGGGDTIGKGGGNTKGMTEGVDYATLLSAYSNRNLK